MRTILILLALSACTSPTPTMTIEVPARLRSAQTENLVGWVWIFQQVGKPEAPINDPTGAALRDEAQAPINLENLTAGETRTVDIELAPDDYWVQLWFADDRFNSNPGVDGVERLPLLTFASTAVVRVSQNEMREVNTDSSLFESEERFDRDRDGETNLDEVAAGTDPFMQSSRSCGVNEIVHCKPTTVDAGPFGALPDDTPHKMVAFPEPTPLSTVLFTHGGESSTQHILSHFWPPLPDGSPDHGTKNLGTHNQAIADFATSTRDSDVLWTETNSPLFFLGGFDRTTPMEVLFEYMPREVELLWDTDNSESTFFWSAWDNSQSVTHVYYQKPFSYPPSTPGEATSIELDPVIPNGSLEFEQLRLRTTDGVLYIESGGLFWAVQTSDDTQIGHVAGGQTVTDFLPAPPFVYSLEYTVLKKREVSTAATPEMTEMVSDQFIAGPLAQDHENIYWLSGPNRETHTKIRFINKGSTAAMTEADDDYNLVVVPSGIRAYAVSQDDYGTRELYLINGNGELQRVFL